MPDIPNPRNFCGGSFQDWLEVNLTPACNAHCPWCIERQGWHPREKASWEALAQAIHRVGRQNILLLGGEPTLYPDLSKLVHWLDQDGKHVYVTTNGSLLSREWVRNLQGLTGLNISIHDHELLKNQGITGILLNPRDLAEAITELHEDGEVKIRFNCNCIRGYIDSEDEIREYIRFARDLGADGVRFAELKFDDEEFVDLHSLFGDRYGLNGDPFFCGCNTDAEIDGMPVNFRQMCGLQTCLRPRPQNPVQLLKLVLYYDGHLYNGWQQKGEGDMETSELISLLDKVRTGETSVAEAAVTLDRELRANSHQCTCHTEGHEPSPETLVQGGISPMADARQIRRGRAPTSVSTAQEGSGCQY